MLEGLRARLEQLLADATASDPRAGLAALQEALVEARAGVSQLRDGAAATAKELEVERRSLADAERRGGLAQGIGDAETVAVAERYAAKHRERVGVLERKLAVQHEELQLAERELEEMMAEVRSRRPAAGSTSAEAAWREVERAGGARPGTDLRDELLQSELDHAAREAAVEAQLAHLKKKMRGDG